MKNTRICQFISLVVWVASCAHEATQSEWETLKTAKSVSCGAIEQKSEQLDTQSVKILGTDATGRVLLMNSRGRNGGLAYYVAPLDAEGGIAAGRIARRDFGRSGFVIGGGELTGSGKQNVVVLMVRGGEDVHIEMRTLADNVVRRQLKQFSNHVVWAQAIPDREAAGFWILYKREVKEASIDELPTELAYVWPEGPKSLKTRYFTGNKLPPQVTLIPQGDTRRALVVWAEGKKLLSAAFAVDESSSSTAKAADLGIKINHELESWAVSSNYDSLLVAAVDGDSLVGQASLLVARVRWDGVYSRPLWERKISQKNEHISEPYWVLQGDNAYVLLPKWVDEEATIATYRVTADEVKAQAPQGVYAKGMRLAEAYYDAANNQITAITRAKKGVKWDYSVCRWSL